MDSIVIADIESKYKELIKIYARIDNKQGPSSEKQLSQWEVETKRIFALKYGEDSDQYRTFLEIKRKIKNIYPGNDFDTFYGPAVTYCREMAPFLSKLIQDHEKKVLQGDEKVKESSIKFEIRNKDVISKCKDSFESGKYEDAVFNAFKLVEEEVRNKAELFPTDLGTNLMTKAFHPSSGKLLMPVCQTPGELESVYNLFKGAIGYFKNPSSHRFVDYSDEVSAYQAISLADMLLKFVEESKIR